MLARGETLSVSARRGTMRIVGVMGGMACAVFLLDRLTKWLVIANIPLGDSVPSSGFFVFRHIENRGAAFGLFPQLAPLFLLAAVAVVVYIGFVARRFTATWQLMVLGALLGGAVANAVDRLFQGYVVDFIDFHWWPIFNVADMAIVTSIVIAVLRFRTAPS